MLINLKIFFSFDIANSTEYSLTTDDSSEITEFEEKCHSAIKLGQMSLLVFVIPAILFFAFILVMIIRRKRPKLSADQENLRLKS